MPIRRNVHIMYAVSFLQGMLFYASISTLYRQACGITVFQITLIESISMMLALLLEIPWGIVADRVGYKRVMVFCSFLLFLSKYLFYIADTFWLFLIERSVLAVVNSGLSGVDTSILYLSSGEEHAQRVFGRTGALNSAGLMLASAIFACLPAGSYRLAALLSLFPYGAAAVLTLFLTEVRHAPEKRVSPFRLVRQALAGLRATPGLIPLLVMSALFFEVIMNITGFFNQLQYIRGGASASFISIALIIGSVFEMSGAFSNLLTRFFGGKLFGAMLIGLCALGCFAMAFCSNIIMSVIIISFMYSAAALLRPLVSLMENLMVASDDRATALSINSMLTSILAVPLNLGLGRSVDMDLPISFAICGLLILASGALFLRIFRKRITFRSSPDASDSSQ